MTVSERVQQVMVVINNKNSIRRTLALSDGEVLDRNLYDGLKEAIGIAVLHKLMPDISAYDIESNIVYAEYYNLSDNATENAETGFWTLRFPITRPLISPSVWTPPSLSSIRRSFTARR